MDIAANALWVCGCMCVHVGGVGGCVCVCDSICRHTCVPQFSLLVFCLILFTISSHVGSAQRRHCNRPPHTEWCALIHNPTVWS